MLSQVPFLINFVHINQSFGILIGRLHYMPTRQRLNTRRPIFHEIWNGVLCANAELLMCKDLFILIPFPDVGHLFENKLTCSLLFSIIVKSKNPAL